MTSPDVLGQIASTSLAGAMLVVALLALRAKDRALSAEQAARVSDARENLQLIMKLQEQVILAVNKLSELVEIWEKREAEREAVSRAVHAAGSHSPYRLPGGGGGGGEKGGT